jgi:hypothetical protein
VEDLCGGTGSHSHQGLNFCGRHQQYPRTQATTGKVPFFTTDTVACSSEYGLGCFKCLSDSHVVCHSAIVGKSPGEAMASAFILAKTSRSPLKKLQGRLIPRAGIGNDGRSPSPPGDGNQDMLPLSLSLSEQARDRIERREGLDSPPPPSMTGQEFDDSKEAERPVDDQALPIASTPGARGCVNYGDGS